MSPALYAHLIEDEDGPALAYHVLARDGAELERLNSLDERTLARQLGRLTARLPGGHGNGNGTGPSSTAPLTAKPTPPTPVSGAGGGAPVGYSDDMSMAEFDKHRGLLRVCLT
jgi:hypothetical protein